MYGTVIRKQIERTNQNLMVGNIILLLLILGYFLVTSVMTGQNGFFIFTGGSASDTSSAASSGADDAPVAVDMSHPTKITVKDLASEQRVSHLRNKAVTLTDKNVIDINWAVWRAEERAGDKRPGVHPNYRVSKVAGQLFIILPPDTTTWPTYTGVLRPLTKDDEWQVKTVLGSRGVQQVLLMPVMLDALTVRGQSGQGVTAGRTNAPTGPRMPRIPLPNMLLILLCAFPVWNISKAVKRMKNPALSPVVHALEKYGPPQDVAKAIDAEYTRGVHKIHPAQFTFSWLLIPTFFTLIVVHLDHIVWIYERVYVTRGRTHAIAFRDRQGGYQEFIVGAFQVKKIIEYVTGARPWIINGYSGQLASDFASNRAQVIAQVDARRQQTMVSPTGRPVV